MLVAEVCRLRACSDSIWAGISFSFPVSILLSLDIDSGVLGFTVICLWVLSIVGLFGTRTKNRFALRM